MAGPRPPVCHCIPARQEMGVSCPVTFHLGPVGPVTLCSMTYCNLIPQLHLRHLRKSQGQQDQPGHAHWADAFAPQEEGQKW